MDFPVVRPLSEESNSFSGPTVHRYLCSSIYNIIDHCFLFLTVLQLFHDSLYVFDLDSNIGIIFKPSNQYSYLSVITRQNSPSYSVHSFLIPPIALSFKNSKLRRTSVWFLWFDWSKEVASCGELLSF
jgi:hypothetical protein